MYIFTLEGIIYNIPALLGLYYIIKNKTTVTSIIVLSTIALRFIFLLPLSGHSLVSGVLIKSNPRVALLIGLFTSYHYLILWNKPTMLITGFLLGFLIHKIGDTNE